MYRFEGLEIILGEINDFLDGFAIFLMIVAGIVGIITLLFYILKSVGLMEYAKKNNIPNSWMAWIPIANMYLLGKLGFEVYTEKENPGLTWALLGTSAAGIILFNSSIVSLCAIATSVFSIWAYYNIFKKTFPDKATLYLILSIFLGAGGVILFCTRNKIFVESNNTKISTNNQTNKFCTKCGNKIEENAQFCIYCGNKI